MPTELEVPLIKRSGLEPGSVHIAWARCPNTVASTMVTLEPMIYFLSPKNTQQSEKLDKKNALIISTS